MTAVATSPPLRQAVDVLFGAAHAADPLGGVAHTSHD